MKNEKFIFIIDRKYEAIFLECLLKLSIIGCFLKYTWILSNKRNVYHQFKSHISSTKIKLFYSQYKTNYNQYNIIGFVYTVFTINKLFLPRVEFQPNKILFSLG